MNMQVLEVNGEWLAEADQIDTLCRAEAARRQGFWFVAGSRWTRENHAVTAAYVSGVLNLGCVAVLDGTGRYAIAVPAGKRPRNSLQYLERTAPSVGGWELRELPSEPDTEISDDFMYLDASDEPA